MRACWLCWTGCLWRWNSPTVTTGLASLTVGLGGGGPHRLVEVVPDHTPFLADDAPQRGRCGPAMPLKHAAVMGEPQRVVFAGSQLRAGDESGGGRCRYGERRRQQDSVAGVDSAMVLDVDRHVAAPVAYQDVGGAGSGCSASLGMLIAAAVIGASRVTVSPRVTCSQTASVAVGRS